VLDISEIDDAYAYVDSGTKGSETTITDIKTRSLQKPKRYCNNDQTVASTNKRAKLPDKTKSV